VVRIETGAPGPRVVMFAGTHGDEISGIHAVDKLLFEFLSGLRTLGRGTLTLVRVNAAAIAAERRYLVHNVNRLFRDDYGPDVDRGCYEFARVQELKPLLRGCDYFLDLHSAPIAQEPFLVAEQHAAGFYAGLGLPYIVMGWGRFGGSIAGDAENYANQHGAVSATLESGSHFEKRSNDVAYATALRMLALLGMIEGVAPVVGVTASIIEMYAVVTKRADDFRYEGEAANFKRLARGEAFAHERGVPLTVAEESRLLIPMRPEETKVGEEVCYLGRLVEAGASAPIQV